MIRIAVARRQPQLFRRFRVMSERRSNAERFAQRVAVAAIKSRLESPFCGIDRSRPPPRPFDPRHRFLRQRLRPNRSELREHRQTITRDITAGWRVRRDHGVDNRRRICGSFRRARARFNAKLARLIGERAACDGVVDFAVDGRGGFEQTTLINNGRRSRAVVRMNKNDARILILSDPRVSAESAHRLAPLRPAKSCEN